MPVVEVMLYLSVILSGRCFNGTAPFDSTPMPPPEFQCDAPMPPVDPPTPPTIERRPPIFIPPPSRPCGCEKDDRPEPKPLPLLFLPKVILNGSL